MLKPLLTAVLLTGTALPAGAEGPTVLRQAALSAELYAHGAKAGDALLILAAAQMRKSLDMQPVDSDSPRIDEPGIGPLSWESMIAEALRLVAADDPLRGLAEDIAAQSYKGVISGPVYHISPLGAGAEASHADLSFRGGEYAEVYAEGEPGSDLNLTVFDDQGRLVCADTDPSHVAYCGWTPAKDGHFTLVVLNPGATDAHYALMTN